MIGARYNYNQSVKAGFTLIEVLVSVTIFAVIILSVTSIFKLAIDGQRSAIATQNVQESLKYFLEVTAKEIRMAQKNYGVCSGIPDEQIFTVYPQANGDLSDSIVFRNYYGECVRYTLGADGSNQRFIITRKSSSTEQSDFISPAKIRINDLHFIVRGTGSTTQAMVTINLNANAIGGNQFKSDMTLQTSITSRYYK